MIGGSGGAQRCDAVNVVKLCLYDTQNLCDCTLLVCSDCTLLVWFGLVWPTVTVRCWFGLVCLAVSTKSAA